MISSWPTLIWPLVLTMRLHNGIACAGLMFAGTITTNKPLTGNVLAAGVALVLLSSTANFVNDLIDLPADRINRPDRPLPSGLLTPENVKWGAAICQTMGLLIGFMAIPGWIGWWLFWGVSGPGYSLWIKGRSWLAPLWTAVVIGSCWLAGAGLANLNREIVGVFALACYFLIFREIIKTVADQRGDQAAGYKTVAGRFPGNRKGVVLTSIPLFTALLACATISFYWLETLLFSAMFVLLGVAVYFAGATGNRQHLSGSVLKYVSFMALGALLIRCI